MFNTLKYAKTLEAAGVPRSQAEAHMQIIAEIVEGNLATKSDVMRLETKIDHSLKELESRLTIKLGTIVTVALAAMATILKFF